MNDKPNAAPQEPAHLASGVPVSGPARASSEAGKDDALERLVDQSVAIRARQSATSSPEGEKRG